MPKDDDELQRRVTEAFESEGARVSSARLGDEKRFYCARCDVFVNVTIGMYVPRHSCGRQLRAAWRDDFERVPDSDTSGS